MDPSRLANTSVIGLASLFLAIGAFVGSAGFARPQSPGSSKNAAIPTEPPPAASPLGAPNNLPNPYLLGVSWGRSEEHTSELQSRSDLVCRLLLEKKKHIPDNSARHCII